MKVICKTLVVFLALSTLLSLSEAADESQKEKKPAVKVEEAKASRVQKPQPIRIPVYNPPRRGAPDRRMGGGTRGGPT